MLHSTAVLWRKTRPTDSRTVHSARQEDFFLHS